MFADLWSNKIFSEQIIEHLIKCSRHINSRRCGLLGKGNTQVHTHAPPPLAVLLVFWWMGCGGQGQGGRKDRTGRENAGEIFGGSCTLSEGQT